MTATTARMSGALTFIVAGGCGDQAGTWPARRPGPPPAPPPSPASPRNCPPSRRGHPRPDDVFACHGVVREFLRSRVRRVRILLGAFCAVTCGHSVHGPSGPAGDARLPELAAAQLRRLKISESVTGWDRGPRLPRTPSLSGSPGQPTDLSIVMPPCGASARRDRSGQPDP